MSSHLAQIVAISRIKKPHHILLKIDIKIHRKIACLLKKPLNLFFFSFFFFMWTQLTLWPFNDAHKCRHFPTNCVKNYTSLCNNILRGSLTPTSLFTDCYWQSKPRNILPAIIIYVIRDLIKCSCFQPRRVFPVSPIMNRTLFLELSFSYVLWQVVILAGFWSLFFFIYFWWSHDVFSHGYQRCKYHGYD